MPDRNKIEKILADCFEDSDRKEFSRDEIRKMLQTVGEESEYHSNAAHNVFLENLLHNISDSIYFKNRESEFIKCNNAQAKTMGFDDPDDLVGKSDFDFFPYKVAIQKFADEQKIIQNEKVLCDKDELDEFEDGSSRWVSTTKMPLISKDGKIIGSFGISRDITDRKLAEEKLQRVNDELRERNKQTEMDLVMARKVQMAFIPKNFPSFTWDLSSNESALNFFHRYIPSETLAGDFFQIIPISNSQAGVIICDVMGHGVRASLVTAVLRGLVGELKMITPYPHVFLGKVNKSLNSVLKQLDVMVFVTAFYGVFDLIKGQFRYANAGHPMPVCVSRKDQSTQYLEPVSDNPEPALGLVDNFRYTSAKCDINAGDSMIFYTDGIVEVEDDHGEEFGKKRLLESLSQPEKQNSDDILESMFQQVSDYSKGRPQMDDMCAVSVDVVRIAENRS